MTLEGSGCSSYIRWRLIYEYLCNKPTDQAQETLTNIFGYEIISENDVQEWYSRFKIENQTFDKIAHKHEFDHIQFLYEVKNNSKFFEDAQKKKPKNIDKETQELSKLSDAELIEFRRSLIQDPAFCERNYEFGKIFAHMSHEIDGWEDFWHDSISVLTPICFINRMELSREQKRLLMLYEYRLGSSAAETARKINEAWGEGTVGESTVRERFRDFKKGNEGLTHSPGAGRPRTIDRQAVLDMIDENPSMTSRMLADEFECSHTAIENILHEAGKSWKKSKWVPHELNASQKAKRVDISRRLFDRYSRKALNLDDIITSDEKWVSFDNPHKLNEWLSPGQKSSSTPVKDFRKDKRMLIVFWSRHGVVYWELLEKGQSMNADLYCQILERVKQALGSRRRPVIFQRDNARPHIAKLTAEWLEDAGWEVLEHPPYSPDLAPSDYHLFRSLEHKLRNKKFNDVDEMKQMLTDFFRSKPIEFYRRGIDLLPEKWQEVIEVDGEYFDY